MTEVPPPDLYEGPPPQASRDEIIKRLVVDELYWDSRVDASKVLVEVKDGVVRLSGHVATCADRYAAEADARMIEGVVAIENELEVEQPLGVPDNELAWNVSTVLDWTPDVDASDIEVSAHEGNVTLRGSVKFYWEKLRAHLLAARVPGVHRVVDELVVVPTEKLSDREIAHSLEQALDRHLLEDAQNVQVSVREGVVTLRGSVSRPGFRHTAELLAQHTRGVTGVNNELTIPYPHLTEFDHESR